MPHTPVVARTAALLLLIAAPLIGGCASTTIVPPDQMFGELRAPEGSVESASAFPRPDGEVLRRYVSFDGERRLRRVLEQTPDLDSWRMFEYEEGKDEPRIEEYYVRAPNGRIVLSHSVDRDEGVVTWFDPPLVLLPDSLEPGETFNQSLSLRVYPIASPDKVKDQGRAEQELTFEGMQRIHTPRGAYDAAVVREVFRVSLSAAKVEKTTERWYAQDGRPAGLLGERWEQVVRVLGLPVRSQQEAWVLDRGG